MRHKLRLVILADPALFRTSLSRALSAEPDMKVAAGCDSVAQALAAIQNEERLERKVDIVLLDLDAIPEAGPDFLSRTLPELRSKILVVAHDFTPFHVEVLIQAGVDGLLLKSEPLPVLCKAIRRIATGQSVLDADWLKPMLDKRKSRAPGNGPFTAREREVLQGVIQGHSSKEIAHRSASSEAAVKSVIQQLFQKTGTRSRAQLVRLTIETGALNAGDSSDRSI